jgi:hypothetical protein
MTRKFSLRGKFTVADNAIHTMQIFDYVSPDRTRAWEIDRAYFWPLTTRAEIGSSDGQYNAEMSLSTDSFRVVAFDALMDASDNRICAWGASGFSIRAAGTDFLAYQSLNMLPELTVDPDCLVTKELHLNFQSTSESTTSPEREWCYLIILKDKKITPAQSVFQQIKGMGQDISGP